MFARFSALLSIATFAAVVAGAPTTLDVRATSECNTGANNCCNSVQSPSSAIVTELSSLLGFNLNGVTSSVGLGCTSVGSINSCTQQPVCCNGDSFSGLIVIGCSPINIL